MRVIKLFEEFNHIDNICKMYDIKRYTINEDGSIDVNGDVDLDNRRLTKLPLKFNLVSGDFDCSHNQLTSLEGSPKEVGGIFSCNHNRLKTIEGSPKEVGGDFDCSNNQLISLIGCPTSVGGDFYSYGVSNKLTTLEGFSTKISGNFVCIGNPIYEIWRLIDNMDYLEIFIDYDMIDDGNLYLARLNDILDMIEQPRVTRVKGYNCI
jgi:hypothetical protein